VLFLLPQDLTFCETPAPHLRVSLYGGKTDTTNQGFTRYVSANLQDLQACPVRLTRLYLARLGDSHAGYVVCRTQTSAGLVLAPDGRHRLSYGRARSDLQTLLSSLGYDPNSFSEQSARRGAVTAASNAGINHDTLQDIVGWKSTSMPAVYTDRSVSHYLSCSTKLQSQCNSI
jgi:hypothetical protein